MKPGHAGASEEIDPGSCRPRIARPECRAELRRGEVAVGGQVQVVVARRQASERRLRGFLTVELQDLGAGVAPAEGAADRGGLVAGGREAAEVRGAATAGRAARRSDCAEIGPRPGIAAVIDVADKEQ
jgi:hypothetical protein